MKKIFALLVVGMLLFIGCKKTQPSPLPVPAEIPVQTGPSSPPNLTPPTSPPPYSK